MSSKVIGAKQWKKANVNKIIKSIQIMIINSIIRHTSNQFPSFFNRFLWSEKNKDDIQNSIISIELEAQNIYITIQ